MLSSMGYNALRQNQEHQTLPTAFQRWQPFTGAYQQGAGRYGVSTIACQQLEQVTKSQDSIGRDRSESRPSASESRITPDLKLVTLWLTCHVSAPMTLGMAAAKNPSTSPKHLIDALLCTLTFPLPRHGQARENDRGFLTLMLLSLRPLKHGLIYWGSFGSLPSRRRDFPGWACHPSLYCSLSTTTLQGDAWLR